MTKKEIKDKIKEIKELAGDFETQHAREDDLYKDFISYIETLTELPELREKAKLVLSTQKLDFTRYCA